MITTLSSEYTAEKGYVEFLKYQGEGTTLYTRGVPDLQIMSDVWVPAEEAFYWDDTKGHPVGVIFKIYDGPGTDKGNSQSSAVIDATPEVYAKYFKWLVDSHFEKSRYTLQGRIDEAWAIFKKGDQVRITKGKTSLGKTGKVVALTEAVYNAAHRYSWRGLRSEQKLLVAFSNKTEERFIAKYNRSYPVYVDSSWVWGRNVDKVLASKPTITDAELAKAKAQAREFAARTFASQKIAIPEGV